MSKISELSDGGVIQGGDTLIAVRSGGNVKVTYGGTTTANIDGGTIDGTTIGGTTPAAGSFTSLTSTGIDVTGTVTADGLNVDAGSTSLIGTLQTTANNSSLVYSDASQTLILKNDDASGTARLKFLGTASESGAITFGAGIGATSDTFAVYPRVMSGGKAFNITGGGNISFYEDSGTTAKLTWDASAETLNFADNGKAVFGAGSDLQIYSDGTNGIIQENTGGSLYIAGADTHIMNSDFTEYYISAFENGAVWLRHDNSLKLATTSTGIDVTGTVKGDALVINGGASSPTHLINGTRAGTLVSIDNESTGTSNGLLLNTASTSANSNVLQVTSNDVDRLKVASNGDISFYEDTGTTAKLFWDASAESLGIGTSSPSVPLTVNKNTDHSDVAIFHAGGGTPDRGLKISTFANINSNAGVELDAQNATGAFKFSTGGTERMRIDSSGSVGINTSSPYEKLTINNGTARTSTSTVNTTFLHTGDTDDFRFGLLTSLTGGATAATRYASLSALAYQVSTDTYANAGEALVLQPNGGNVGIGITSPSAVVHAKNTTSAAQIKISDATNTAELQVASGGFYLNNPVSNGTFIFRSGTGYTERMRLDSAGNLLVGTTDTDPSNNSANSTADDGVAITNVGEVRSSRYLATENSGAVGFFNRTGTDGDIVRIRRSGTTIGSLGVDFSDNFYVAGDSSHAGVMFSNNEVYPYRDGTYRDATLDLGASSGRWKDLYLSGVAYATYVGSSGDTDTSIAFDTANSIRFSTAGSEAARFDSSGNLIVGTTATADSAPFSVFSAGTAASFRTSPTTAVNLLTFRNGNGLIGKISTSGSTTTYSTSSDQRLKDNIVDAPSASDDIDAIQVRSFDWKADGSHQKYGMVAQELMTVAPEAVSAPEDPDEMMGVDYSKLVPMMLKEIQSLRARVAQLEGAN